MKTNAQVWAERRAAGQDKFDVANEVVAAGQAAELAEQKKKYDAEQVKLTRRANSTKTRVKTPKSE